MLRLDSCSDLHPAKVILAHMALTACRNPRSDYNWTVRDPGQVETEYRGLEEKLKSLTRGLNKRVSMTGCDA